MNVANQLSARDKIHALVDNNSFVEVGAMITKRSTDFNLMEKEIPADGVITGYGTIDGNPVYIYCQDVSALNGTIGEMHAKKIANIYDKALKVGAPVIGFIDCAGIRLQEATDALHGLGEIFQKKVFASGVIPQITAILGTCGGGLTVLASLSDFTFMTKDSSKLFINSPNAINGNHITKCNTSSSAFQVSQGMVEFELEDEVAIFTQIRELINILPASNDDNPTTQDSADDLNRYTPNFSNELKDITLGLRDISDNNYFLEVRSEYAKEMVTGFIRLNGMTIGAIGNRLEVWDEEGRTIKTFDGSLTTLGCNKAERFVKFCDAFNIPILTLTNVSGYMATLEEERTIALASARLTYEFTNATVPKVNVIVGKGYGSAYVTMNSKHIGADMVFALPQASIGMMESNLAIKIMYPDGDSNIDNLIKEYDLLQSSPLAAAKRGYIDSIIEPESTRKHLIYAFEMLFTKRDARPTKKHGSI